MARLLVVDDDASMLAALGALLRSAGHEAVTAQDGKEGSKEEQPGFSRGTRRREPVLHGGGVAGSVPPEAL